MGVIEVICNGGIAPSLSNSKWCNRPIRLVVEKNGRVKHLEKISDSKLHILVGSDSNAHSTGGATTNQIYEETTRIINSSMNASDSKKEQAQDVLKYVKEYAPYFLPAVADGIKKVFYL